MKERVLNLNLNLFFLLAISLSVFLSINLSISPLSISYHHHHNPLLSPFPLATPMLSEQVKSSASRRHVFFFAESPRMKLKASWSSAWSGHLGRREGSGKDEGGGPSRDTLRLEWLLVQEKFNGFFSLCLPKWGRFLALSFGQSCWFFRYLPLSLPLFLSSRYLSL